jgi:hypothetical protein
MPPCSGNAWMKTRGRDMVLSEVVSYCFRGKIGNRREEGMRYEIRGVEWRFT